MNEFLKIFETADKLKKVMQKKNLRVAKCKCPHCENGYIYGSLNGKKDHLYMKCDSCTVALME